MNHCHSHPEGSCCKNNEIKWDTSSFGMAFQSGKLKVHNDWASDSAALEGEASPQGLGRSGYGASCTA